MKEYSEIWIQENQVKMMLPRLEWGTGGGIHNLHERDIAFNKSKQAIAWCEKQWGEPSFTSRWTFNFHTDIGNKSYHIFYFRNADDKIIFQLTWL